MIKPVTTAILGLLCAASFALAAQAQVPFENSSTAKIIPEQIVVDEAAAVIGRVKQRDADIASLIDQARAVLVVPRYGATRSAQIDRVRGSAPAYTTPYAVALTRNGSPGVFLVRSGATWSSPAFFSAAATSDNATHAGTPLLVLFMTRRAVSHFMGSKAAHQIATNGTFSLSGLEVANYSTDRRARSDADVVVWTPAGRRFRNNEFYFDAMASDAYYRNNASLEQILADFVGTQRSAGLQSSLSFSVASAE